MSEYVATMRSTGQESPSPDFSRSSLLKTPGKLAVARTFRQTDHFHCLTLHNLR